MSPQPQPQTAQVLLRPVPVPAVRASVRQQSHLELEVEILELAWTRQLVCLVEQQSLLPQCCISGQRLVVSRQQRVGVLTEQAEINGIPLPIPVHFLEFAFVLPCEVRIGMLGDDTCVRLGGDRAFALFACCWYGFTGTGHKAHSKAACEASQTGKVRAHCLLTSQAHRLKPGLETSSFAILKVFSRFTCTPHHPA